MDEKKRQRYSDLLELLIVFAMVFLIVSIYLPVAIWEEEDHFEDESHFRMKTLYNIEDFYSQLTGNYNEDAGWAMNVVNAVRDSLIADSTYLGQQNLHLMDRQLMVDVYEGYDAEYDTTFGFQKTRRDTIVDTTVTIIMYDEVLSREDTSYIQIKDLAKTREDPLFRDVVKTEPKERVETVTYYATYRPDSTMLYCPLIGDPYGVKIDDTRIRIASPIVDTYEESRYGIFKFTAENHGYIENGSVSWENK